MTPNEVRVLEGMPPYDGGDAFTQVFQGSPLAGGELPTLGTDVKPDSSLVGVQE
jgi:hypothetical protein